MRRTSKPFDGQEMVQKSAMIAALFACMSTHALDLEPGWYAGAILGANYTPKVAINTAYPLNDTGRTVSSSLSYSYMGAVGGQMGYRIDNYRLEGEFLFNNSPYAGITVGQRYFSAGTVGPNGFQFQGATNTYALLFNAYYDLFSIEDERNLIPYMGLGVGGEIVQNTLALNFNGISYTPQKTKANNEQFAFQGTIGAAYYWDECTSLALDFRYLTGTGKTINGYFNSVTVRPSVVTLNLVFNTTVNLD